MEQDTPDRNRFIPKTNFTPQFHYWECYCGGSTTPSYHREQCVDPHYCHQKDSSEHGLADFENNEFCKNIWNFTVYHYSSQSFILLKCTCC